MLTTFLTMHTKKFDCDYQIEYLPRENVETFGKIALLGMDTRFEFMNLTFLMNKALA